MSYPKDHACCIQDGLKKCMVLYAEKHVLNKPRGFIKVNGSTSCRERRQRLAKERYRVCLFTRLFSLWILLVPEDKQNFSGWIFWCYSGLIQRAAQARVINMSTVGCCELLSNEKCLQSCFERERRSSFSSPVQPHPLSPT